MFYRSINGPNNALGMLLSESGDFLVAVNNHCGYSLSTHYQPKSTVLNVL